MSTLPPTQSTDELIERFSASQALVERASRPRAKLFQIARNSITIEHCSISDIALQIEPSGKWLLRLRGDQNPIEKTEELIRNKDIHIRRNAFRVQVRLLTTARSNGENRTPLVEKQPLIDQAGKLALVSFDVEEFWVQREAPMYIAKDGYEHGIVNSFADIDQAEFEFFVRLDPLTGSGKGVVQPWHREP